MVAQFRKLFFISSGALPLNSRKLRIDCPSNQIACMKFFYISLVSIILTVAAMGQHRSVGRIVALDPHFSDLFDANASIEVLADTFAWAEGPVWVKQGRYVLFSDIPHNTVFKWSEAEGLSLFLKPAGYTGILPYSREPGSNGLIINQAGQLVSCEHGDRRISAMPMVHGGKKTLADNYQGRRFNSPNDIVQKSNGDYYFTDPAYGLPMGYADTLRETGFMGVYRLSKAGGVSLLVDSLLPNGIAFSPDEKTLFIGQSDAQKPFIYSYPVKADGTLGQGHIFFDCSTLIRQGLSGAPDGMKVDRMGNLFATGPGGLLVIDPTGKLLGRLETTQPTANCAWGDEGSTLYITAKNMLCRIRTRTRGLGF